MCSNQGVSFNKAQDIKPFSQIYETKFIIFIIYF